jgi:EAL domain-containing protein (putative c-di-GMP-specific phosphodiesterase class I)
MVSQKVTDMDSVSTAELTEAAHPSGVLSEADRVFREKILHVLGIYPKLGRHHLQISLGTSVPASVWKPVLDAMIRDGTLKEETIPSESPSGRQQNYTAISICHIEG